MHAAFDVVDEVWAATDFVAEAVRAVGRKPVFTVPLPVLVPRCSPEITRERLSLPYRFTVSVHLRLLQRHRAQEPAWSDRRLHAGISPGRGTDPGAEDDQRRAVAATSWNALRAAAGTVPTS